MMKEMGVRLPSAGSEDVEMLEPTKRKLEEEDAGIDETVAKRGRKNAAEKKRKKGDYDDDGNVAKREKDAMDLLVQQRLDELQGKKTYKVPRRKTRADVDRKIVHELRDVYKDKLKRQAGRQGLRDMEQEDMDYEQEEPPAPSPSPRRALSTVKEKEEEEEEVNEDSQVPSSRGKKRPLEEGRKILVGKRRARPQSRSVSQKRTLDIGDDEEVRGDVRRRGKR